MIIKIYKITKKIVSFFKSIITEAYNNDITGLSAEIAFYGVFSLFPMLISLIALLSIFARDPSFFIDITSSMYSTMPAEIAGFLKYNLHILANSEGTTSALIIGMLITLWTSSNVIMSFIKGLNRSYEVRETRSYFHLRRISVSLVFSIGFLLLVSFLSIIYGEAFTEWILNYKSIVIPDNMTLRINFLRWSFTALILFLLSSLLYFRAPNIKQKAFQVVPGAIFFSVFWILGTYLFGIYLNHVTNYSDTYGTLGITIVLLLWLFITAGILLIGAEINAYVYPHIKSKSLTDLLSGLFKHIMKYSPLMSRHKD